MTFKLASAPLLTTLPAMTAAGFWDNYFSGTALPIGIQTFSKIVQEGYLYVDKTPAIYRLITEGEVYFLSRLRRFGKSLLFPTAEGD